MEIENSSDQKITSLLQRFNISGNSKTQLSILENLESLFLHQVDEKPQEVHFKRSIKITIQYIISEPCLKTHRITRFNSFLISLSKIPNSNAKDIFFSFLKDFKLSQLNQISKLNLVNTALNLIAVDPSNQFKNEDFINILEIISNYVTKILTGNSSEDSHSLAFLKDKIKILVSSKSNCELFIKYVLLNLTSHLAISLLSLFYIKFISNEMYFILRSQIIELLKKQISMPSKSCPEISSSIWNDLISTITAEEWQGKDSEGLQLVLLKAIKKAPEGFALNGSKIFELLPLDLSSDELIKQGISGFCFRMMKSEDFQSKRAGIILLKNIAKLSKELDIFSVLITQILDALVGKFPGVSIVSAPIDHHRFAILLSLFFSIKSNCSLRNNQDWQLYLLTILPALQSFFEKEKDGNLSALAANILNEILLLNNKLNHPNIDDFFKKSFSVIENAGTTSSLVKTHYLMLISSVLLTNVTLFSLSTNFQNVLLNILKESNKKVGVLNADAYFSLVILSLSGLKDSEGYRSMKLFHYIKSSTSFLYTDVLIKTISNSVTSSCMHHMESCSISDNSIFQIGQPILLKQLLRCLPNIFLIAAQLNKEEFSLLSTSINESNITPTLYVESILTKDHSSLSQSSQIFSLLSEVLIYSLDIGLIQDTELFLLNFFELNKFFILYLLLGIWNKLRTQSSILQSEKKAEQMTIKKDDEQDQINPSFKPYHSSSLKILLKIILSHKLNFELDSKNESTLSGVFGSLILFITSHPSISDSLKVSSRFWCNTILSKFQQNEKYLKAFTKNNSCISIFSKLLCDMLASQVSEIRNTGYFSFYHVFDIFFNLEDCFDYFDEFQSQFLSNLQADISNKFDHFNSLEFSPSDFNLYLNVDKEINLELENLKLNENNQTVDITNADRKKSGPRSARRGQFGSDVPDDIEWLEKIKKDKLAKLQQSKEGLNEDEKLTLELKHRHQYISDQMDQLKQLFDFLNFVSKLGSGIAKEFLGPLFEKKSFFLLWDNYSVLSEYIIKSLISPVQIILEEELSDNAWDLLASLKISVVKKDYFETAQIYNNINSEELPGPISRYLRSLQRLVSQYQSKNNEKCFSASSFVLTFPILESLILSDVESNCGNAISILESLWFLMDQDSRLKHRYFLSKVYFLLLKVLIKFPRTIPIGSVLQKFVFDSLPLSNEELDIFLGEFGLMSVFVQNRLCCSQILSVLFKRKFISLGANILFDEKIWLVNYDVSEPVQDEIKNIIHKSVISDDILLSLVKYLNHPQENLRKSAALAIANGISLKSTNNSLIKTVLGDLKLLFVQCLPIKNFLEESNKKEKSSKSKPKAELIDEKLNTRLAIAELFVALSKTKDIGEFVVIEIVNFLLEHGVVDPSNEVKASMLVSGTTLVNLHCSNLVGSMMKLFEDIIARNASTDEDLLAFDNRNSAAVVFLGSLARHLDKDSPTFFKIFKLLLDSLKTPSESVQRSVSDCLSPLAQLLKNTELAEQTVEDLMNKLLNGSSYGERRGAAFGLSAMVKGLGIPSLKQYNIIPRLKENCQSGSISNRQGSLFGFECMAERLGLLFEPYIINIVDTLLSSFSHSSDHVRDAAQGTTKVIMAKLSAHGVKQILAPIVSTLATETSWKSRQEAIKMLGMMANCAPKQLGACLPQIIPSLVKASTDPHPKVKECAKIAMHDISSVIKNPEISQLSPILLNALADPANKTKEALESLLQCEFMHSIDPPSLALLIPILGRALKDRGADLKRKAAAITGNIITMINDSKTLSPYISTVVPGLQDCLLDPIPDVRASGAKALGTLYNGLGDSESGLQEVLNWLLETLKSEKSPVERSGAAQGLAEICGSCTQLDKKDSIIQWVLGFRQSVSIFPREGLMWFLSFLPYTLRESFSNYIPSSLPVILKGLSDDNDGVREVAMRAGKVIVSILGVNHGVELAPALLSGLSEDDWRIRSNSLQLLGDLLILLGDGKIHTHSLEDDDDDLGVVNEGGSARVLNNIKLALGVQLTEEVLSAIYIVRSDISIVVRQNSLQIWKSIVSNTPRTLVEIMPVLINTLVFKLSSDEEDLRIIAGRAIGELVMKLGDKVLPVIVSPLHKGLNSQLESKRLGVCLGLEEVLNSCTKRQAEEYIEPIIETLKVALCDSSALVCEQAARAFMTLYKNVGSIAVDEIVPALLNNLQLGGEESSMAVRGLKEIVSQRPRDMLEYLLPMFIISPISLISAKALTSVIEVAGQYIHYHFGNLIPTIIHEIYMIEDKLESLSSESEGEIEQEKNRLEAIKQAAVSIVSDLNSQGVHQFVLDIGKQICHDTNLKRRKLGCWFTEQFFTYCKINYFEYLPVLLKFILSRVADQDKSILISLKDCLTALSISVPLEELINHVDFMKNCISSTASSARHRTTGGIALSSTGEFILPLFSIQKSLDPLFTIFLYGLMNGNTTIRELCADMIGELSSMAEPDVLKPTLMKVVGPLIRVIGERYPSGVKAAILKTLIILIDRGGPHLKAFAPQLQTTFVKSLNDPLREVRIKAALALGKLMNISLRVDPLLTELSQQINQVDSNAIKHSIFEAIISVMNIGGDKASASSLDKIKMSSIKNIYDEDDSVRLSAATCLSSIAAFMSESQITDVVLDIMGSYKEGDSTDNELWPIVCGRLIGLASIMQSSGLKGEEFREEIYKIIQNTYKKDERTSVKVATASSLALLLSSPKIPELGDRKTEFKTLAQNVVHRFANDIAYLTKFSGSSDVRTEAIRAIKNGSKFVYGAMSQHMNIFFPALISITKDIDLRVKYAADKALKHLCDGPQSTSSNGSQAYQNYLIKADPETSKYLRDYYSRILTSLTELESDHE